MPERWSSISKRFGKSFILAASNIYGLQMKYVFVSLVFVLAGCSESELKSNSQLKAHAFYFLESVDPRYGNVKYPVIDCHDITYDLLNDLSSSVVKEGKSFVYTIRGSDRGSVMKARTFRSATECARAELALKREFEQLQ